MKAMNRIRTWSWRLLVSMCLVCAASNALATDAITEIILLGAKKGKGNALKNSYREQGWTVVDKDLNANAGGWDVYIAYKTSADADPETGYITDICVSTSKENTKTLEGRTYYLAPTNSGYNGDLNRDAGGADIWVYYTRDHQNHTAYGGTQRVITKLSTTKDPEDGYSTTSAVSWRWTSKFSGLADVNEDAGGDDIYIQQHFATQTLTVREAPKAAENIVFDGTPQFLVANHPSGNFGTMKYRVVGASAWSTSLPRATHVGTYTVEYYLDGGIYAYNSATGSLKATINPPVFSASSLDAVFNQSEKSVSLFWSVGAIPGGYDDFKWVLYRGNTKIATLTPSVRSYSDKGFENEKIETYTLYYVSNAWDINTKNEDAAISKAVDCTRRVPVNNFTATSYTNYIELTWTSDGFPEGFGNKFNIYVDNETSPACTIEPTKDHQVSFTWQHRTTADHTNRQNKVDPETGVTYTEEPLNGCQPHDYRVEGVIGTTKLNEASVSKKSIGQGTLFYSFEAEKGVYPGMVKLNWHVNQQQDVLTSKTYIIDRRIAERADDRWTTIHRMNSAEEYVSYTDETPLPGIYYDYRVTVQDKCDDGSVFNNEITDIGFAHTTGTVSGRITYGTTGTAVSGADVVAVKTGEAADGSNDQYYSIHLSDSTGAVLWEYPSETYSAELLSGDFSIQMWMYPEKSSNRAFIFFADNIFLGMAQGGGLKFYGGDRTGANSYDFDNLTINPEAYSFLTLTRTGSTLTAYVATVDQNGSVVLNKATKTLTNELVPIANPVLSFFNLNTNEFLRLGYFQGYIDEFRLWKKCLTEQEILENFDHLLVGNEKGLETYWTFDENLRNVFFDSSREGTLYHQHHGRIGNNAEKATLTPSALALKAKTDQDGNYIIRGIPFSGEGATYSIVPTFGVHRFNPTQQLRYIGNNSLVHNGVDFDDVSSFRVRGVVYYEHTTIPVQEAYIYIDGAIASKDGKAVQTNDYGEFEVSVPIGDHFISVEKQNHVFLNGGRYPADPDGVGVRHTFDREISGLTFYDQTKVTVAGRVVGGDIEHEKPLGLGVSIANIGQAKLRIELSNENGYLNAVTPDESSTAVSYDINPDTMRYETASGTAYVPGNKNYIVVETDPNTGEWIAELLPLKYDVTDVTFPFRPESAAITKNDFSLPVIDATKPMAIYADSVQEENGEWRKFECMAAVKMEYKATSVMDVVENQDGSYGMRSYLAKDINGNEHEIPLYRCDENGNVELDANGKVQYTFGYPVYEELGSYSYRIYAYERYTNYDGSDPVSFDVPLAGKNVTIKNQFASTTAVSTKTDTTELGEKFYVTDEEFELDDDGKAIYQFQVGFPNIVSPFTRSMSISYDNNGTEMSWRNEPFEVIVLGVIPTGNNFVTKGPDKVLMVLRDPPGSGSKTTWRKGTSVTDTETDSYKWNTEDGVKTTFRCGAELKQGAVAGLMVISSMSSQADIVVGANYIERHINANTDATTITSLRDISTSSSSEFVGAPGDVFIGKSQNLLFGICYGVNIAIQNNVPVLLRDTSVTMGEEFETFFSYDQFFIRGTMLPNYAKLRNNLLQHVDNIDAVARPASGEDPIYVTTLSPDDPRYGTSNNDTEVWGNQAVEISKMKDGRYIGPSYTMLIPMEGPQSKTGYQDMVNFYNAQVKTWEDRLSENEQEKVTAIANRSEKLIGNYSFSAGTTITESTSSTGSHVHTHEHMHGLNFTVAVESGYGTNGFGFGILGHTDHVFEWTDVNGDAKDSVEAFTYTLADGDYADYLTVDVLKSDKGSPIFSTRGGATSCPYEDQDTTYYYEPGTVISGKTMQIEKPEIEVLNPIVTGVPAGEAATLKINIRNNCEVGYKVVYDIKVTPGSNPDGLEVLMDGVNLNRTTSVFVKPDETMVKTLSVRQTNPEVLSYENITLRLASQCQNDPQYPRGEIADHATFSVYFQPTCSDIKLESSHTLVNTDTETPMTLSMSGYNYSMTTLKSIRLQYKAENDADFRTIQEYVKDQSRIDADPTLLPLIPLEGTAKLNYVLDLRSADYADKTYVFRAVTVCDQGGKEVTNESEEIRVIRDMSRPALIATPSPSSGVLSFGDDILITFNEDIQGSVLTKPNNFDVIGILNEGEVAHDVALNLSGDAVAKTDAAIDLSGRSFAFSMWLKYSTDGTLLTHGTVDHHFSLTVEDGYLAVTVAGQKTLSTAKLPVGKWIYLNVSYNADAHVLNAGYAQDDFSVMLMDNLATEAYDGHGAISLGGNGLTAQVQELVLWNGTRSMVEAQSTMYTTKTRYTHDLLGYWPFNEGHGTMATEIARSRHMTLPSQSAWWINGANYALTLDGTQPAIIAIGALNTTVNEDYLIETWFSADLIQDGAASIFSTNDMEVRLNTNGYLELALGTTTTELLRRDLRDGQWHHLALNVLKSTGGSAVCYLDGEPCSQIAASAMPNLSGAQLILGQGLKGAIDDIRIWKARRTADVIKQNRYLRMASDEAGLVAYYPMEKWLRDEYNQIVSTPSFNDMLSDNSLSAPDALSALNTPALQPAPKKENVQFNFVASERQIKINIDEQPAKIEGCNISITAKRIKDINGNEAQPVTWNVYVQQNKLRWNPAQVTATKTGVHETTFTADIENYSSQSEVWTISGLPTWLHVNTESGTVMPLETLPITFTVDESLPIGTYAATVYLTGSQNIEAPLNITVVSEGEAPDWSAVPGESTMTIVGVLRIDGIQSSDTKDMIAAFRGTECVGVAHPQYFSRYDSYMVLLTIYGKQSAALTYKLYDASTGTIYPSVSASNEQAYTFGVDKNIGSFTNPVVFTPLNEIEQDLSHDRASWKWFSLYAQPKVNSVSEVFKDAQDAITVITSGEQSVMYWLGDLTSFAYDRMYKLQAIEAYDETLVGEPTDPTQIPITLKANGWTWIGYPAQATNSLDAAFAGAEPLDGDMIKNQSSFALYTEGEWLGTLRTMTPGDGYMYNSGATSDKVFTFPKPAANGRTNAPMIADENSLIQTHPDNMTMIAVVMDGMDVVEDAQISVYAGGELRGYSAKDIRDGIHFLTIGGEAGQEETLTFLVGLSDGRIVSVPLWFTFVADGHYGSMDEAVILQIGGTQGLDDSGTLPEQAQKILYRGVLYILRNGEMYDATGKKL